jgi:predicted ATPase/DNA-binding CsgD family transcriptional regulator
MNMTNLPVPLTSFIGREKEMADLVRLVNSARLVTLTGAGGCGKTRLALWLANEIKDKFIDGVFWVEVAPITDPELLPQGVAKTLDISVNAGDFLSNKLVENLRHQSVLIVLDNCEHLVTACASLVERLLQEPGVSVLITSRESLAVIGEVIYPVSPLSLPPVELGGVNIQEYDAIQLFVERARAIVPGFTLTPENREVVASICRQLDGIPLAIELASARINVLSVEQIDILLSDRFRVLGESRLATTSHHRSMRATLDWSYNILSSAEQIGLRRLSVFAGGCSLTTAEAVCAGNGIERGQILELLASLISKSLVVSHTLQRGDARYSLIETIRQYAYEKLVSSGELSVTRERHLECFVQLTEETLPKLSGVYQQLWLDWLEGEFDNIRSALDWSLETDQIEKGLRIAVAIYQFWTIRDYAEEGVAWLERLLSAASSQIEPTVHANALAYAVFLAGFRRNIAAQIRYGQQAAMLVQSLEAADRSAFKWALTAQAYSLQATGDYETQFNLMKRVIDLNRELGDKYQLGLTLSVNSFTAMSLGKFEEAQTMLGEALVLLREVGNPYRIAMALNFSGDLARCKKNYVKANASYEESIFLLRQLDAPRDLGSALQNLGFTCLHLDQAERAYALFSESLTIQRAQQNTPGISECLLGFAAIAGSLGLAAEGSRLLAVAVTLGGQEFVSKWAATKMEYEHSVSLMRAEVGEATFLAEQLAGRKMTLEQAVELAQRLPLEAGSSAAVVEKTGILTAREREVAVLIALGRSNGEIADELVLSKRTVEKHVAHIMMRLGVTNRTQIVRWTIENRLMQSTD